MFDYIEFDSVKLHKFKATYRKCVKSTRQSFIFERKEFLIDYAKCVIEYLEWNGL